MKSIPHILAFAIACSAAASPEKAVPGSALHAAATGNDEPATSALAKPTPAQMAWQDLELGALFHLDPRAANGAPSNLRPACSRPPKEDQFVYAKRFNPVNLDTDEWISTAKDMGARQAVLVITHETGFRLWQSDVNPYSVKILDWRDGKGDVLRDFVNSCRKYGIKPGIFMSARWNVQLGIADFRPSKHSTISQKDYMHLLEQEMEEVCSRYGELSMVWWDGDLLEVGRGGPDVLPIIDKYQPHMIFKENRDRRHTRWGGSESGMVDYPCWATVDVEKISPEKSLQKIVRPYRASGDPVGKDWVPALADAALSAGNWWWHPRNKGRERSLPTLQEMYLKSIGRNASLFIGIAPDPTGEILEADKARCEEFGDWIRATFEGKPLAETSGNGDTLNLELPEEADAKVQYIVIQEEIAHGERVREYLVEAELDGVWKPVCKGSCIGRKRIEAVEPSSARKFRLRVTQFVGEPRIKSFSLR